MQKREKLPPSSNAREAHGYEKKQQQLRQRINDAFFGTHWTRSQIREYFGVSSHTVLRWTQAAVQDCSVDGRGWRKGVMRSHSSETLERISLIHHELSSNPEDFFTGASAIAREWSLRFTDPPPPVRTIGIMLKELHLSTSRKKGRQRRRSLPSLSRAYVVSRDGWANDRGGLYRPQVPDRTECSIVLRELLGEDGPENPGIQAC